MTSWLLWLPVGLLFGGGVSVINHLLVRRALNRIPAERADLAKGQVMGWYALRMMVNFLVLYLVYHNVPLLVGTALGLTSVKNVLLVQNLRRRR